MYKDRLILFIDLLGFKSIVNRSVNDEQFLSSIYELLKGITAETVSVETFGHVNRQLVSEERIAEVEALNKRVSESIKANSTLAVTHFSDSLVISADAQDTIATFSILELVAKLSFRLWNDYQILTRGGLTIGKLVHEEGGVLIGPAMVRAYELESVLAVVPRVLIDEVCVDYIKNNQMYRAMEHLFKDVANISNEQKGVNLDKGLEINLATAHAHFLNSHYSFKQEMRTSYLESLKSAEKKLTVIRDTLKKTEVQSKYSYLIDEVAGVSESIPY